MDQYKFFDSLMLRTPFLSYEDYMPSNASSILEDVAFKNALYLANPILYQLLAAKEFNWQLLTAKERLTISRYYNRICFRPTPFGAFSSFSLMKLGRGEQIKLDDGQLHLQLDQEIALQLASGLTAAEPLNQTYKLNPALYKVGREFRFIKTIHQKGEPKFTFSLESFESNKLTRDIFGFCQNNSRTGIEIALYIEKSISCTSAEAIVFFNFLMDARIFKSVLDCNIVGEDYLGRLLSEPGIPDSIYKQKVSNLYTHLKSFKPAGPDKLIGIKDNVNQLLKEITGESTDQVFYAGLERKVFSGNLDVNYKHIISGGLNALQLLVQHSPKPALGQFINNFKSRYDKQKIPLLQAIDPEMGLDYGNLADQEEPPLLKDVKFKNLQEQVTSITWTAAHRLLFERWCSNKQMNDPVILNEQDLLTLSPDNKQPSLSPSFPVVFRVLDDKIFIESSGGVSANSLIGRFTPWSTALLDLCKQIARTEATANPDMLFAEIGQISDTHADNINRRRHIYKYEIPINVSSTLPPENQIALTDLLISVQSDQIVLESATLKKTIIPRLTSAYNFSRNHLAVFRFLCDLQYQGIQSNLDLDLENFFPGLYFYPRVVYNQAILCLAKWNITKSDVKYLTEGKADFVNRFKEIREKLQLPALIALTRNDQQLVFNLDKKDEVSLFLECLKGLEKPVLQEFLIPENAAVNLGDKQPLINQFIAFLYTAKPVYSNHPDTGLSVRAKIKRDYLLGSKWVYLKIYCRPSIANDLLIKKILPLVSNFDHDILKSWFFVRYTDTSYHIRLRLRIDETQVGNVLSNFKDRFTGAVSYQLVREYQSDIYRRELERYGSEIIEEVEELFYASSKLITNYIKHSSFKSFPFSYHSLAFVSVNYLLEAFLPVLNDQITFLNQMVNTFYAEFSGEGKSLKLDLDLKYRQLNNEIRNLLLDPLYFAKLKLTGLQEFFRLKTVFLLNTIKVFSEKRKLQLLADLIHMHLNRVFVEQPRNQELIVYYCLYKHRLSVRAMKPGFKK